MKAEEWGGLLQGLEEGGVQVRIGEGGGGSGGGGGAWFTLFSNPIENEGQSGRRREKREPMECDKRKMSIDGGQFEAA